jgi:Nuclear fragile X mental retardation-interacting protein 1 (NUFIP1)
MFEYKNEFFALRTPAEIRGWIADRKKWYPTTARIAGKQAEQKALQEKRARESELNRKVLKGQEADKIAKKLSNKKAQREKRKRRESKLQRHLRKAEKLRKRLEKDKTVEDHADTEPRAESKPDGNGIQNIKREETLGERADTDFSTEIKAKDDAVPKIANPAQSVESSPHTLSPEVSLKVKRDEDKDKKSDLSSVSVESSDDSDDESDDSSNGLSDSDDDLSEEEAPVEQSSKLANVNQIPQPKSANTKFRLPCKYFIRDGSCKRNDCRFAHEVDSGRQLTLFERVSDIFSSITCTGSRGVC